MLPRMRSVKIWRTSLTRIRDPNIRKLTKSVYKKQQIKSEISTTQFSKTTFFLRQQNHKSVMLPGMRSVKIWRTSLTRIRDPNIRKLTKSVYKKQQIKSEISTTQLSKTTFFLRQQNHKSVMLPGMRSVKIWRTSLTRIVDPNIQLCWFNSLKLKDAATARTESLRVTIRADKSFFGGTIAKSSPPFLVKKTWPCLCTKITNGSWKTNHSISRGL